MKFTIIYLAQFEGSRIYREQRLTIPAISKDEALEIFWLAKPYAKVQEVILAV